MNNDLFEFKKINCPVCNCVDNRFLGYRGGEAHHAGAGVKTSIVRCSRCSHQYPNPMPFPRMRLDELYINADDYFHGWDIEEKQKNCLEIMKWFESRHQKKGKFLDVGCGTGELMWAAQESGWEVEGVDPSKEFIELGIKNLNVTGKTGTLEDVHFPDNYFDAVAMSSIIEHLYDPLNTLHEVYRILKPNGWLWFDAPNEDGLYMHLGNLYMRLQRKNWVVVMAPTFPPYHVQGFNPRSVGEILNRTGFELREMEILGEIWEQTNTNSVRKKIENSLAKYVNFIGKRLGKGMYMSVWAQKP